jgi:uncharacterized membrane protein YoaK (UPF0700 family)
MVADAARVDQEQVQGEPALLLALCALTAVTGVVDAASYLALGSVFTANMTGNVVFLGFAVAGAPGLSVARSITALAAFLIGALLGNRLAGRFASAPRRRWAACAFAGEAALLSVAALTALGFPAAHAHDSAQLYALIVLCALAMGGRNATVQGLGVPELATTVLTRTLVAVAAGPQSGAGGIPRWLLRLCSVLLLLGGAACGVLLLRHSLALPLAVCAGVTFACALVVLCWPRYSLRSTPEAGQGSLSR